MKKKQKQKNINLFKDKLKTTMKFWPRNILERINIEEDKQFLISLMTNRKASMGALDTKLKKRKKIFQKEMKLKKTDLKRNSCDKWNPLLICIFVWPTQRLDLLLCIMPGRCQSYYTP